MAKIPMGNFGQAMPDVQRINLPQNQSGQIIGGALQNVSQVTNQVADQIDKQQREQEVTAKRLELYNNDLDKREGQLKVDEVIATDFNDKVVDLKNQVGNGALTSDKANADLKEWSDARFAQIRAELPDHAQKDYQDYWSATVNKQSGAFFPLQIKASEQKEIVLADRAFEIATRLNRDDGREYLIRQLDQSNIPESRKQELKLNYESTRDKLELDTGIEQAFAAGDTAALQQVQVSIKEKTHLDGPTAQRYSASISSKLATLKQRAEVVENKRINEAGKVLNQFKTDVLTGRNLDESYLADVKTAVAGTEHEAEYGFYINHSKNFSTFSKLSTSEQLSKINQSKAEMKNSTTANAENEKKVLGVYESIYQEKLKTLKENPTQALSEAGIKVPDLNPAELKVNSGKVAKDIASIGSYQVAMKDKDANLTIKPISPEALPAMKAAFDGMSVNQKLDFIGQQISATKGVKGGTQIWGATLGQLGGGDKSYIMAGVAKMNNFRSEQGEDVAAAIVSGTQALKNKQLIMPKDEILFQKFNEYVGNSSSGETSNMTYAAFKSVYAHLAQRENYQHKDKDDIDKRLANAALSMATGGVYEQAKFGNQKWKVSKPYGMSDDRFEYIVNTKYGVIAKKYNVPEEDVRGLRLRRESNTGPNGVIRYSLLNERGTPVYYMNMPDGVTK